MAWGDATHILNHSNGWKCVSLTLRSLYHQKQSAWFTGYKTVWAPETVWTRRQTEKSAPVTGVGIPSSGMSPGHQNWAISSPWWSSSA